MGVFRTLGEKPWLSPSTEGAEDRKRTWGSPQEMVGLRFFLVVVTLIFLLLTSVYVMRMGFPDWRPLPEPALLWINTAVLILSSVALEGARRAARRGRIETMHRGLAAGGVLGIAFLLGQLLAWRELAEMGYFAADNPANAFFYLITALHWVHLAGGVVAWTRSVTRAQQDPTAARTRLSVELCAVYWHFLLLVWLAMFALLLFT